MTEDLSDVYGEEFATDLKSTIQEKQQEREKLSERAKMEIADKAINENGFDAGDPMFTYQDPQTGVTHDVLLMEVPEPENKTFWSMKTDLDSGAVTLPLLYLGEFMSCLFNDKEEAKKLTPGDFYIVAGRLSQWEDDQGRMNDQLSPVRGVIDHEEAKALAEEAMDQSGISEPEPDPAEKVNETEPEPKPEPEEEEDNSSDEPASGGFSLGEGNEEEAGGSFPATQEEVDQLVERFADDEPAVWELDGEDERFKKLVQAVAHNHDDLNYEDEEHLEETAGMVLDRIEREQEEEDEEEDDDDAALFEM